MALIDRFERFLDQVIPAPDEAVDAVRRGDALRAAGDLDGALRLADHARRIAPGYLRAVALRCDVLVEMARPFDALAELDAVAALRALPVDLLARMAELVAAQGPPSRVAELDAHVRARVRPPDPAVARRMTLGARALAAWDEALSLRFARTATVADPACAPAWAMLGDDAADRSDLARARALLSRAASSLDATDADGNARVGALAERVGDVALASRCLRRAWIAGDDLDAHARLVGLLARAGDASALAKLLPRAGTVVAGVARALLAADRGEAVAPHLEGVAAGEVPAPLWSMALAAAVRGAPEVAARWVDEAPTRPHALAVAALAKVRGGAAGELDALLAAASTALADPVAAVAASDLLRDALASRWSVALSRCLEELARVASGVPALLPFVDAISLRRKEIDESLRVVVLGEFSAGKSTFVNVLVGREVSPMGVLPTTASVHWLRFGEGLARVIDARGAVVECAVVDAPAAVARRRREGVAIDRVEVTLPLPRLAAMELIDTPGFNAGDPEHERAARSALALADLALWLFDARQAGRHSEREPLEAARDAGVPALGVLNKVDQVPEGARGEVLALLRDALGGLAPCVAAVSARSALEAQRIGGDAAHRAIAESGWAAFERWLDVAVVDAREGWKRARVARRAERDLAAARSALDAAESSRAEAAAARLALAEDLDPLREALREAAETTRRELVATLRDQARGLRDARTADAGALLDDAVAEAAWRATRRATSALRARFDAAEALAVRAGIVPEGSRELVSAPSAAWIEHAVRDGVREAFDDDTSALGRGREPRSAARALPEVDPLAALRALLDGAVMTRDLRETIARVALDAAVVTLARCVAPPVVVPPKLGDAISAPSG